jgi:hypothetical protein
MAHDVFHQPVREKKLSAPRGKIPRAADIGRER